MPINYYCDVEVQSNVLTTDVSNSRVGINDGSPVATLHVNGNIRTGPSSGSTYVNIVNDEIEFFNTGSERATMTLYPNSSSGSLYIYGADGSTIYFGAPASYTTNIDVQGSIDCDDTITINPSAAGNALLWKESDSTTIAGQLRSYANRGDIYLYNNGTKLVELSPSTDSFIPALHIGGTAGASGGVLQTTGNVNIDGALDVSSTATIGSISNASSDTDKFLVSDSGVIKYRTGAEVRADIGAGTGDGTVTGTGSSGRVAVWSGSSSLTSDSEFYFDTTNNRLGIGVQSSPQSPLHVKNTTTDDIVRIVGASGGKPQINIYEGTNNVGRIICTGNADFNFSNVNSGAIGFFTGGSSRISIASGGNVTITNDLTISGGDLTLGGTGRIQGVDTVSAGTDAANKNYVDQHVPTTTQTIIVSNFQDTTSTTSALRIPFNSLNETTSNQYYNCMDMPANGSVKRFRMHNTSGSLSTGFTTTMSIFKNGSTTPTSSGALTASSGQIEWEPSNYTFNKGDHLQFTYAKSAGAKYWQGVSASIIIEFNQV